MLLALCLLLALAVPISASGPFAHSPVVRPNSTQAASLSTGFSLSDGVGTWNTCTIIISPTGVAHTTYGTIVVDSSGQVTGTSHAMNGTTWTDTSTFAISPDGRIQMDGADWGVMSYDRNTAIGYGQQDGSVGLTVCVRAGSGYTLEDAIGHWRINALQVGSVWTGWTAIEADLDATGALSGNIADSDGGSDPFSAQVGISPNGELSASDGSDLPEQGFMSTNGQFFIQVAGDVPSSGAERINIGMMGGGDFIPADLAGEWHFCLITKSAMLFEGTMTTQSDGTFAGTNHDLVHDIMNTINGTMSVTPEGVFSLSTPDSDLEGQGTLSLDRSTFIFVFTDHSEDDMGFMVGTKHPTDLQASVDVTEVSMDWGNGFSFRENMDLSTEGTLCNRPAVVVHPSNLQTPAPPPGATAAAGLVYGLQSPVFASSKITLPVALTENGDEIYGRFEPELALSSWLWPARTGDIEIRAVIDNIRGDDAPEVGNGVLSASVGFSVHGSTGWSGDVWLSFGFATAYLAEPIGELEPGFYNRAPFVNFGSYHAGNEDFSVALADGYDPAYPVELKVVITPSNLARYFVHFGPFQIEWRLVGEQQIDWWPGPDTGCGGCGTSTGNMPVSYYPYVESGLEYIDTGGGTGGDPVEILTTELPDACADTYYSQPLEATSGEGELIWEIVSGELPYGLSLQDGWISGYPWDEGLYRFTVAARDNVGGYDEQELAILVTRNLLEVLQGQWEVHRISLGDPTHSASVAYGVLDFEYWGSATLNLTDLDGSFSFTTFSVGTQPDGTILADGKPWGALSLGGKRIIAAECTKEGGSLLVCTRHDPYSVYSQADCEGTWAMHSFMANGPTDRWTSVLGTIDSTGAFTGTQTDSDGASTAFSAEVSIDNRGMMQIVEPGNTMPQHSAMSSSRLTFGRVMGSGGDPARFDIGVRTGGQFTTADMKGEWRFKIISSEGDVSHARMLVDEDGNFAGESWYCDDESPDPIAGTIEVGTDGALAVTPMGRDPLSGRGTLGLDKDFFVYTFAEEDRHVLLVGNRRAAETSSSVDVTRVSLNWGNGFGFDDPLDLDTEGTACNRSAVLVDGSYMTTPALPPDGQVQAFYTRYEDLGLNAPIFEPGKLTLSSSLIPGLEYSEYVTAIGASTMNVPWSGQYENVELRAVFENLYGDASHAGDTTVECAVGFHVTQGDRDLGDIKATLGLLTAYFHRGISGIPAGVYDNTPFAGVFSDKEDGDEMIDVLLLSGFDPSQPVEVKLIVTPHGYATSFVKSGTGEWMQTGSVQCEFWPSNGLGASCHIPEIDGKQATLTPFIIHEVGRVQMADPDIHPDRLDYAVVGSPYEAQFWSEEGESPFQWSISAGSLPEGLYLDEDGLLSGTPEEAGTFRFTVRVEDNSIPPAVAEREYDLTVLQPVSILDAKALHDGALVVITDAIVTRAIGGYPYENGYYVESRDRSAGIKFSYGGFLAEGWTVDIIAQIYTDSNQERILTGECRVIDTDPVYLRPVGMPIRSLGGADFRRNPGEPSAGQRGVAGAAGLNNIGLLVKTWGKVTQIHPYGDYFYVNDGSDIRDGTVTGMEENLGVRVDQPPLDLQVGDHVTITGISSCMSFDSVSLQRRMEACTVQVHFPAAPMFVLGCPDDAPGGCQIIFTEVLGATGYRLYESDDGVTYTPVSADAEMNDGHGMFLVIPRANRHYKVAPLGVDGAEGRWSRDVYARVADAPMHFDLYQPSWYADNVSLRPNVCNAGIDGAVRMGIGILRASSGDTVWGVITYPWMGCTMYGRPGPLLTHVPAMSLLEPYTDYLAHCYAIDEGNWSFASTGDCPFRTRGQEEYGGGAGPPPPPPL